MSAIATHPPLPFPSQRQMWPLSEAAFQVAPTLDLEESSLEAVRAYASGRVWIWPERVTYFLTDIHADADAFRLSLLATGGVAQTGPNDEDIVLTPEGREALFVIGGDLFDKGPHNLRLLRALRVLLERGAEVKLLAGNHDLRTYVGIACAGSRDVLHQHLFVRMGKKAVTLFVEVFEQYVRPRLHELELLSDSEARRRLFPDAAWFQEFPRAAAGLIRGEKLAKEAKRIREKCDDLAISWQELGHSLGVLHATVDACRRLFLEPGGEFAWVFERMQLCWRAGSFLFVHAGVDDEAARQLNERGVDGLNAYYRELLQSDLFTLYHGFVGNMFRTKYRDIDLPFSAQGLQFLQRSGIHGIIHGHRNILRGQRVVLRSGVLNFECDASVDRNTRRLEQLEGPGGAALVIRPQGEMLGISTDYPYVKVFDPTRVCQLTTLQQS